MKRIEGTPQERIEHNRVINGDCWETRLDGNKKYPQINIKGKKYQLHRIAYSCYVGPIPRGLMVLHACDNPRCHNPKHLFLGTAADNMRDMVAKGRQGGGRKAADIDADIKALAHFSQGQIAEKLGVSQPTVSKRLIRMGLARGKNTSFGKGHGKNLGKIYQMKEYSK